ncbi:hypothetical protein [Mesorhizobium sp. B1-1-8]|uniref:hypothetical protein n=1 Tax=Mesorhizobium sp. B1-1-8 TaxID=2589976 RepID=UPI00112AEED0|nr:hypothetical protein [Mesorhizobium sp. B1-1-8]UCI05238.1 hypothetical protein FJ974_15345 [Mesorhizobium sp. B1-1-8]
MTRRYFGEFNRVRGDNIRLAARRLRRRGLDATILSHRTTLEISRPEDMPWSVFTGAIRAQLQPRRGSVMISSEQTGNTFLCSFVGNQTGRFRRQ